MARRIAPCLIALLAIGLFCSRASATLISSDSFTGYSGSINGESGGYGWAAPWQIPVAGDPGQIISPGFTYPNLPTAGDKLTLQATSTNYSSASRRFNLSSVPASYLVNGKLGADNTTVYVSFLARNDNAGTSGFAIDFGRFALGQSPGGNFWRMGNSATTKSTTDLSFILLRFDFAAPADQVSMWINPDLTAPLPSPDSVSDPSISTAIEFDDIFLRSDPVFGSTTSTTLSIDEINVGTDLQSVIPEPTLLALLPAALLLRRRRNCASAQAASA